MTRKELLDKLYPLRLLERKPGWDSKVRAITIEALVQAHYDESKSLNTTAAFLEIAIAHMEGLAD